MNKWKQTAVLLFFLGGFCLCACGNDVPEQAETGKTEVTESIEEKNETKAEVEEAESNAPKKQPAETKEAANDAAEEGMHDEKYYIAAIEDLAGDGIMANEILYQFQQPYTFLLHMTEPTGGLSYDDYRFRNIVEDDLEEIKTHDTVYRGYGSAYIADCVLDKYIREYGGEDTKYHVRLDDEWRRHYSGNALYDTHCFEIYNEDVTLYVIWNGYIDGIVTVLIEDDTSVETDMQEFLSYVKYSIVDYRNKHYHREAGKYWMLINPDSVQDTYCYRNVNPKEHTYHSGSVEDETLRCYIADQVIDKYIRDYLGSDTLYQVEPLRRIWGEEESDSRYGMELINGEEILRVKYSPDSWLVDVEVLSGAEYEAYYMEALNELAGDNLYSSRAMIDVMKSQIKQPCTFLMHLPDTSGMIEYDQYQYRNIEEGDLKKTDEDGVEYIGGWNAYVVECVLDKYIREYDGEDTVYHFKMVTEREGAEELYGIYNMEIYNEDIKLYVAWNIYVYGVVSVLIEGDESARPHMQEFVSYARYSAVDYKDKHYHHEQGTFWTLVNPEVTQNEHRYRNINPEDVASGNSGIENTVLLCDVADLVLNKYIMEWLGSDVIYQVEGDIGEDGCYSIKLTNGEELLKVSYQPDSWLVSVEVVNGAEK
ncbi:MAG: hypothetical protein NC321_04015 [Clostridium sp.]|nr:hypothetical protein [Clostridium sp.]